MNTSALTIHFAPIIPDTTLWMIVVFALAFLLLSAAMFRAGMMTRALCVTGFLLVFLNPSHVEEQREPVNDVAVIVADRSPSQKTGDREVRMDKTLAYLREELGSHKEIDVRVLDAPLSNPATARETKLFEAVDQALADVPVARRAGVILSRTDRCMMFLRD